MLVQALAEYADTYLAEALNDAAWESKPVPWMLEISRRGTFLAVVPRMQSVSRGKKQVQIPLPMSVPRSPVLRNSGHHPLLGVDDIAYVLGTGPWTPDKPADREKAENHFDAFVKLIERAASATADKALSACASFYSNSGEVDKARSALAEAKPGALVALSVEGPVVDRPEVQAFWRQHYECAFAARMEGNVGECLVSGRWGPIAPTHEKVKGVSSLGGQAAGVALMSFDKEAFRSYGWEQNQNSPVSPDRALAYVLALNALLRSGDAASSRQGRRRDIAGVGFVSWLRDPDDFEALDIMERADPDQVKALLGFDPHANPDVNRFYLIGLSGNGGRLRVRYWLTESLNQIKENLKGWHQQLRLYYPWDDAQPVRFWQLLYAIHREGKAPAHDTLALLRRGLEGPAQPLGYSMLGTVLTRLRHPAEKSATAKDAGGDRFSLPKLRVPLGLIRMCINDLRRSKGETEMSEGLDPSCTLPAYVCGRLMAEFENLQRESSESEVNSSVLDRYFALASTYPAAAFPKIETLGQKHLRKLRRDKAKVAYAIDARLQELHRLLLPNPGGAFPSKLGLDGQGLFALGYYHQKAWSIAQAKDRKQSNQPDNSTTPEEN
ncbi:MAG TPA: type I-C CRISPR-associated protein Cas8c/Csd1 [Bryobacteraceae bacterium]|nr:type I-C CRISPR-associated protein Cas8c/Csd1 [Bryobacteraceae bacterium]